MIHTEFGCFPEWLEITGLEQGKEQNSWENKV
jgi:hypothetical protein